jgi:hypothetical protein
MFFDRSNSLHWQQPKSREVGSFGGISLYIEVLQFAMNESIVSTNRLISEEAGLGQRFRGSLLINKPTPTIARDALRELEAYGWIQQVKSEGDRYIITDEGKKMAELALADSKRFRRTLATKIHERFIIPGWIVYRLLELNPQRQGEIILPSPIREKELSVRKWEEAHWAPELEDMARESASLAMEKFPGSFPVNVDEWVKQVQQAWNELGEAKRKKVAKPKKDLKPITEKPPVERFSTRRRLSLAMREASINLLFANESPRNKKRDFESSKHPIPPRSFRSWCPILEALEFIFYTDHHHEISGRLIFPCGGFLAVGSDNFEDIEGIKEPYEQNSLKLFQPKWDNLRAEFMRSLQDVYFQTSKRVGSLYVSLLDVRDEVCRRLRLSSVLFDEYLGILYHESIRDSIIGGKAFSLSLESDMRPEQQSGSGLLRRPVYIDRVPYSLIAISTGKIRTNQERSMER